MPTLNGRLRALCDLAVSGVRENAGLHDYDGRIQDLSPDGVRSALSRLGGDPLSDPHDEVHLATFEALAWLEMGELELHRRNPLLHIAELDLSCYDRDYAPAQVRAEARRKHLAAWPDAVDAAVASLDAVPAPVAAALAPAARGLAVGLDPAGPVETGALAAHARFVAHVERADAERDRLRAMLAEACARLAPGRPVEEVVAGLLRDHPDAEGVLDEARQVTAEAIRFTAEHRIVPDLDGECVVGPAPPSRRWALAMMSWAAPFEPDAPSRYYITPPEPDWPADEQEDWLAVFSRTTLPAITVHEVAPGHFAHGRRLRRADGDVRRTLHSAAFIEGWAHYAEEVCLEEGFRADDPRFAAGVALEALQRVTRLAVSIGVHGGSMTMDEAVRRFEADSFAKGPAAAAEATRATYDPTYGRYTWGKLELLRLRDQARTAWGAGFSLERFHGALLALGAPPLGLMAHVLDGQAPNGG